MDGIILINKEETLSIYKKNGKFNTFRFIFSKWTLKEGWDNPNVFTIAKLRSSGSENSKIQEVGRGLRLPVNDSLSRVSDEQFYLNYIVDFTEKNFAEKLINEINGDISENKVITDKQLNALASSLGKNSKEIFIEMLQKDYIDMDKNIITINRDRLFSEYPDLNIGLKSGKIINTGNHSSDTRSQSWKYADTYWKSAKLISLQSCRDENVNIYRNYRSIYVSIRYIAAVIRCCCMQKKRED